MRIRGLRPFGRGPRIRPEDFVPGLRDPWQTSGRVRMRGVHLSGDFRGIRAFHGGMGGLGMSYPRAAIIACGCMGCPARASADMSCCVSQLTRSCASVTCQY